MVSAWRIFTGHKNLVERVQTAGEITRDVQDNDGVLARILMEEVQKVCAPDQLETGFSLTANRSRTGLAFQKTHFAEKISLFQHGQNDRTGTIEMFDDLYRTFLDDIKRIALLAFADNDVSGCARNCFRLIGQKFQGLRF